MDQVKMLQPEMYKGNYDFTHGVHGMHAILFSKHMLEEGGKKLEPVEEVTIELEDQYVGAVVNKLNARKGIVSEMKASNDAGRTRITMMVPTRGLLGCEAGLGFGLGFGRRVELLHLSPVTGGV